MSPGAHGSGLRVTRLGAACLAAALALASCDGPPRPAPPDLVLIVIDTARADHFSCDGYARATTPAVDALARDGVLFRAARATAPWTVPSHASLFTGLPPSEHGLGWSEREHEDAGPATSAPTRLALERLLAARLAARGYATLGISSNPWLAKVGLDRGFERFLEVPRNPEQQARAWGEWLGEPLAEAELQSGQAALSASLFGALLARDELPRPFFAFFNLIEPHFPYLPPPETRGRFGGRPQVVRELMRGTRSVELALLAGTVEPDRAALSDLYDEELAAADEAVGRVLAELRARGLYDEALIVVTSDHGELLGEDGHWSHQLSMAEELLRVPLVVKLPGNALAGTVIDDPHVTIADVYRTLLAAAGIDAPEAAPWSLDLAHPEAFDRRLALAEYGWSPDYLAQVERASGGRFDAAPHRVLRSVLVADGVRYELVADGPGAPPRPVGAPADEAQLSPELLRWLAEHARAAGALESDEGAARPATPATLDALRELGYVE